MSKTNIYILKLTDNKYYVGKSKDPDKRFLEHMKGIGSTWTAKYKPIEILEVNKDTSPFDEDKLVKEYMSKFGVENVRGGSYVKEELDEIELYNLKKEIRVATDCCTQCGRKGHFVKDCFATTDVNGENLNVWICENCNKEYEDKEACAKHEKKCLQKVVVIPKKGNIKTCFDCGKSGHYATECPNKKETFNCIYCNKEFDTQKGATFHENVHCREKYQVETFNCQYCDKEFETQKGATFHENVHCNEKYKIIKKKTNNYSGVSKDKCYRCGRSGHYSNECYANTHVGGYDIDSNSEYDSD